MSMEKLAGRGNADDVNRVEQVGRSGPGLPDWLKMPPDWPKFMGLSRNQVRAIRAAEQAGYGGDGRPFDRDKVNAGLAQMAARMQERAAQVDAWLAETHARIAAQERFAARASVEDWKRVHQREIRGPAMSLVKKAKAAFKTPSAEDDAFHGIRWAMLLDSRRRQGDPAFSNVALWSRDMLLTHDGGLLEVKGDVIRVPGRGGARTATAQAGEQAILEAAERGWDGVEIVGNSAFAAAARRKAVELGLSARVTVLDGIRKTVDRFEALPPEFGTGEGAPAREESDRPVMDASEDVARLDLPERPRVESAFGDGYARLRAEQATNDRGMSQRDSLAAAFARIPEGRIQEPETEIVPVDDTPEGSVDPEGRRRELQDEPDPAFA
ncbi:MAG: hypothetical protein F4213_03320 [Boseongicola sp. SB0677_bin_26]|nr:hypothetical protein [Boseongicola sp. SB0665_bin_10]MYG25045.1 hypothetical protein [Boseongicola sp. SB0677_bin_26]